MVWGVIAQVAGGLIQGQSAGAASAAQAGAADRAALLQRELAKQARSDNLPMLEARNLALNQLLQEMGLPGIDTSTFKRDQELAEIDSQIAQLESRIPEIRAGKRSPVPDIFHEIAKINPVSRYVSTPVFDKLRGADTQGRGSSAEGDIQSQIEELRRQRQEVSARPIEQVQQQPAPQQGLTAGEQFQVDEAIKAAKIAAGGQLGGNALRGLTERVGNIARLSRGERLDRLANLAGLTQQATTAAQGQQQQAGIAQGNQLLNAGSARATGYVNQSNALTGTLQGLNQQFQFNQSPQPVTGGFTGTPSPGVQPGVLPQHIPGG